MNSETLSNQDKRRGLCSMILIAALVGVIAGFGAVIFRYLIGVIHNLSFLGTLDPNGFVA